VPWGQCSRMSPDGELLRKQAVDEHPKLLLDVRTRIVGGSALANNGTPAARQASAAGDATQSVELLCRLVGVAVIVAARLEEHGRPADRGHQNARSRPRTYPQTQDSRGPAFTNVP
jgi:hypothetical protein